MSIDEKTDKDPFLERDLNKCKEEGTYILQSPDGIATCFYFNKEKCPYYKKIKNSDRYFCNYWNKRVLW